MGLAAAIWFEEGNPRLLINMPRVGEVAFQMEKDGNLISKLNGEFSNGG